VVRCPGYLNRVVAAGPNVLIDDADEVGRLLSFAGASVESAVWNPKTSDRRLTHRGDQPVLVANEGDHLVIEPGSADGPRGRIDVTVASLEQVHQYADTMAAIDRTSTGLDLVTIDAAGGVLRSQILASTDKGAVYLVDGPDSPTVLELQSVSTVSTQMWLRRHGSRDAVEPDAFALRNGGFVADLLLDADRLTGAAIGGKIMVDSRYGSFDLGNSDDILCPSSFQTTHTSSCYDVTRPAPLAVPNRALAAAMTFVQGAPWLVALVADAQVSCSAQAICSERPECLCEIRPDSLYSNWLLTLVPLAVSSATRTIAVSAPANTSAFAHHLAASSTEDGRLIAVLGWQTYKNGMFDQAVLNVLFVTP
jgi:hypothetical protein